MMEAHVKGMGLVRLNQSLNNWLDPMLRSHGQGLLQLLKIEYFPRDKLGVGSSFHRRVKALTNFTS